MIIHIAVKKELNEDLFKNAPFSRYKPTHYIKDEYRNLRAKYQKVKSTIVEDMHKGNKSKYNGYLSKQYELVEQICKEIDEANELRNAKKDDAAELEKVLKATEVKMRSRNTYGTQENRRCYHRSLREEGKKCWTFTG